jgi:hypothetical protein
VEGEGGPIWTGKQRKRRNPKYNNGGGSPEKTTPPESSTKSSIGDEPLVGSTNRRHQDEALDETNATIPSNSAEDTRIESKCSPELSSSWNHLRTSANDSGSFGSNLRVWF